MLKFLKLLVVVPFFVSCGETIDINDVIGSTINADIGFAIPLLQDTFEIVSVFDEVEGIKEINGSYYFTYAFTPYDITASDLTDQGVEIKKGSEVKLNEKILKEVNTTFYLSELYSHDFIGKGDVKFYKGEIETIYTNGFQAKIEVETTIKGGGKKTKELAYPPFKELNANTHDTLDVGEYLQKDSIEIVSSLTIDNRNNGTILIEDGDRLRINRMLYAPASLKDINVKETRIFDIPEFDYTFDSAIIVIQSERSFLDADLTVTLNLLNENEEFIDTIVSTISMGSEKKEIVLSPKSLSNFVQGNKLEAIIGLTGELTLKKGDYLFYKIGLRGKTSTEHFD